MRIVSLLSLTVGFCSLSFASNPRGDDLRVAHIQTVTHEFELSPDLLAKAIAAREIAIEEGRFGVTRTNPDGIIVSLEIEGNQLWVTGIGISGGSGDYTVEPTVIPTAIVSEPIRASWFSGEIIGYYGRLQRFHIREKGYIFQVREGEIISKKHVSFATE